MQRPTKEKRPCTLTDTLTVESVKGFRRRLYLFVTRGDAHVAAVAGDGARVLVRAALADPQLRRFRLLRTAGLRVKYQICLCPEIDEHIKKFDLN